MEEKEFIYILNYYGFVYITTNLINGKKYIGKRRFKQGWEDYLGSGKFLLEDIKKHGKKNFKKEIIEVCITEEVLNQREHYWIQEFNAKDSEDFYNITDKLSGRRSRIRRLEDGIVYDDVQAASECTGVTIADIEKSCQYKFYVVLDKYDKVATFERHYPNDKFVHQID